MIKNLLKNLLSNEGRHYFISNRFIQLMWWERVYLACNVLDGNFEEFVCDFVDG